ncbi:MAG: hypothetical protein ACLGIV_03750 [Actinomycetes bacterium]
MNDAYRLRHVEQRLAEDDRTAELGVHLREHEGRIFVGGQVASGPAKDAVLEVVREMCPGCDVVDEMSCADEALGRRPEGAEVIR